MIDEGMVTDFRKFLTVTADSVDTNNDDFDEWENGYKEGMYQMAEYILTKYEEAFGFRDKRRSE